MVESHVDWRESALLADLDQTFARQFEQGEKGHDKIRDPSQRIKELTELKESASMESPQDQLMRSRTESCSRVTLWCPGSFGPGNQAEPGISQVVGVHVRKSLRDHCLDPNADVRIVPADLRQLIQPARGLLHLFVFEQPPHQFRPRIQLFRVGLHRSRQQHTRLDFINSAAIKRYSAANSSW